MTLPPNEPPELPESPTPEQIAVGIKALLRDDIAPTALDLFAVVWAADRLRSGAVIVDRTDIPRLPGQPAHESVDEFYERMAMYWDEMRRRYDNGEYRSVVDDDPLSTTGYKHDRHTMIRFGNFAQMCRDAAEHHRSIFGASDV